MTPVCGIDIKRDIYLDLISENAKVRRPVEAERWFRRYAAEYKPSSWDWDSEGDRLDEAKDHLLAADAYERAAGEGDYLAIDFCWATQERLNGNESQGDLLLSDGRKCVEASVKNTDTTRAKRYAEQMPVIYRAMATVLEDRGVHSTALEYIKESLSASPDDAHSLYEEALIFSGMQRYSECVSAAQAAIAASDGKHRFMQFGLANCLFDMENWSAAAASFRIAADDDKTDAAPAFNLALCFMRQGFSSDARIWFGEALKRNPSEQIRDKILNALKGL